MLEGAYIGGRPKSTRCSDVARRFAEVGGALFEQRLRLGVRVFERRPRYVYIPDEWREKALSVAPQASRRNSCSKRATPFESKYTYPRSRVERGTVDRQATFEYSSGSSASRRKCSMASRNASTGRCSTTSTLMRTCWPSNCLSNSSKDRCAAL